MQLFLQNDHLYGLLIDNFTILFRKGVQIKKFRIIWKAYWVLNTWNIKTRQLYKIHQFTVSSKILCPHLLLICTSSTFLVDMLRSYHDLIALWNPFPAISWWEQVTFDKKITISSLYQTNKLYWIVIVLDHWSQQSVGRYFISLRNIILIPRQPSIWAFSLVLHV